MEEEAKEKSPKTLLTILSEDGKVIRRITGKNKKGQSLPSGVYYYVIDLGNEYEILKGSLTIVR